MYFKTKEEFLNYLKLSKKYNFLKEIGSGSQGISYLDKRTNKVYKVFHQFFDKYNEDYFITYTQEEFLKFSHIKNNTFKWASDVIMVDNEIVGYISDYINAKSLYQIDPLTINLNKFSSAIIDTNEDIKIISDNGVLTYDVVYNILYGTKGISIIDHDEYTFSELDSNILYRNNCDNFNYGIMYFLIDNYFEEFISNYKYLKEMYNTKGININEFIELFRKYLSEVVGERIVTLKEAKQCLNKKKRKAKYQRSFVN